MIQVFTFILVVLLVFGLASVWSWSLRDRQMSTKVEQATCSDIYTLSDWVRFKAPARVLEASCLQESVGEGLETCHVRLPGDTMLDLWGGQVSSDSSCGAFHSEEPPTYGIELRVYVAEDWLDGRQLRVHFSRLGVALFEPGTSLREVFSDLHVVLISASNPPPEVIQGRQDVFRALLDLDDLFDGSLACFKLSIEYANTVWDDVPVASCDEIDLNPDTGIVLLRYGAFEL